MSPNTNALVQSQGSSSSAIYNKVLSILQPVQGRLLDLGCGRGEFLKLLSQRGWADTNGCDGFKFEGIEKSGSSFALADLNKALPYENSTFDVVTAIEVIEHLENPRHLIREATRLLRPGGVLVVTTPNIESFTSLISLIFRGYPSAFADACYPAHITPVLEIDLKRMLGENGLIKIQASWSEEGRMPGFGLHWQAVLPFLKGSRFSDNIVMKAMKR